jgi:hypothetical protein
MLPRSYWGVPVSFERKGGEDEGEIRRITSPPKRMLSENTARVGDEGKAVRRGALAALLFVALP